ncbi:MAG: tRNA (adenosine(37)-N6)-threonylcarbamoyltransferase complex dimerization subunit type 1 TsaB [Lachnospiraceae bacterium]|nr:tRNA (adenosine(37)-N6)-threonylcarbamoyltransferase complex dimerization subunit type 1 TsaB [Lachnospiraceae bacterium]
MKILALDSSGLVASVAIMEDDTLTAEYTIQYKKTHSQTLLPMLDEIGKMIELDLNTIDAIAVAAGPGSFTGLRIGSATAKGLGLALKKPLIAVPTIEGLAYNMYGSSQLICPIMDARRGQVYTGVFEFLETREEHMFGTISYEFQTIISRCAVTMDEMILRLNELGRSVAFVGDGIPVFADKIKEDLKVPYLLAPAHRNRQSAASVAMLAQIYYRQGKIQTAQEHQPEYLRLSQAERERIEQQKQQC